jgi:polar amino acid transport system substrate-binding protein
MNKEDINKFRLIILFLLALTSSVFAQDLKQVSLQLQWKYQFQFAGYIMAKEKGFYKDIGLDVELKELNYTLNITDELLSKKSQYGIVRPTTLIDIANGKKIVYLANIFQSSPLVLLADKSSNIKTIKDFKNKKVMSTGDMNSDISLLSMIFSQGMKIKDFSLIEPTFKVEDLLNKKTDLMASYISNEPYILKQLGGEPVIFNPKDYGFDFYSDILTTSEEYIKENPKEVREFVEASLKGWEYAFSHINETANIIYDKYNSQNKSKDSLLYEAQELKKLAYYKTDKIGKIEKIKLEKIYDIYKLLALVQNEINFKEIVYDKSTIDMELTKKEKNYLKKKNKITMCIDPNWMPFESFDAKGNYIGMSADYFKLIENILSTKIDVVNSSTWSESIKLAKKRKCDIMSLVMQTPERKEYLNFTTPYLKIPLVVTTKLNVPFIDSIKDIKNETVGISKGYAFVEILREKYPDLKIVEVENIDDGLERVNKGDIFAYIGTLASVGYQFQTKYSGELKITGKIADNWELGIGVRNDDEILLNILQKAVNNITEDQRREILNKWISIKYEKGIDYELVWQIIFGASLIIALIAFWNNKLRYTNKRLEQLNKELSDANSNLKK